jgi:hypothetical protein
MTSGPLFRKATKLNIDLPKDWSAISLQFLSTLIDVSHLEQIKLDSYYFDDYSLDILTRIATFIRQAHNVSSLIIYNASYRYRPTLAAEKVCLIVPHHVKHLQVPANDLDEIQVILERCKHLSSVQFNIQYSSSSNKIVQWLAKNTINSTYRKGFRLLTVWLGRIKIESNDTTIDQKRMKLSDEYHCT